MGLREPAPQGLGLVVEVDQEGFVEAGLDEAVGVAVEAGFELATFEEAADVAEQRLALEMRHRSGLRGRDVGGVAQREHVGRNGRLKRPAVDDDEAELIAQPGQAADELRAAMQGIATSRSSGTSRSSQLITGRRRRRPGRC